MRFEYNANGDIFEELLFAVQDFKQKQDKFNERVEKLILNQNSYKKKALELDETYQIFI
jgi:hypothetical protein